MRFKVKKDGEVDGSEDLTDSTESEVVESAVPQVELTHTAVGIYHDLKTNNYHSIRLRYNPLTKDAKVVDVGPGDSSLEAEEQFKITAAKEIFE